MRKRFITYPKYNFNLLRPIIYFILILLGFLITIKILFKSENKSNQILAISTNNIIKDLSIFDFSSIKPNKPETLLSMSFGNIKEINYTKEEEKKVSKEVVKKEPLIYIYNTHQTEEYTSNELKEYNITPTVYMAANILKKKLSNLGIESIVEDENIVDVLRRNNWKYSESYNASWEWLNKTKEKYPTVKYYIDLHRDSTSSSITINDKPYAKMMFVIGMNHDNYEKNEKLMLDLNNYLKENYEGLMRDVFYGKRSRYNQHFNENTILIEVGGPKNNIEEVQNSVDALSKALAHIIGGQ